MRTFSFNILILMQVEWFKKPQNLDKVRYFLRKIVQRWKYLAVLSHALKIGFLTNLLTNLLNWRQNCKTVLEIFRFEKWPSLVWICSCFLREFSPVLSDSALCDTSRLAKDNVTCSCLGIVMMEC